MPVPYAVKCECGNTLQVLDRNLDIDGDLSIVVEACEVCEESYKLGEKEA